MRKQMRITGPKGIVQLKELLLQHGGVQETQGSATALRKRWTAVSTVVGAGGVDLLACPLAVSPADRVRACEQVYGTACCAHAGKNSMCVSVCV